ncbi:MAG: aminotransferase class I/II-fold pyridoxal phosphate-dependent enzyme [Mycoplasma sp.]|nr:aminotransferase class I/II-fold pyridoxal phosphate-dependent enzyme [Mycoplasma sp.]
MIEIKKRFKKLREPNLFDEKELAKKYGFDLLYKLNYNENKFGPFPELKNNLNLFSPFIYPRYKSVDLVDKLSDLYSLNENNFFIMNGSDAILDFIPTLFASKTLNQNVIVPSLTYSRIAQTCVVNDITVKEVDLVNGKINLDDMLNAIDKNTSIIYIVNPNMPTGIANTQQEINDFLEKVPKNILVLIDEAYREYSISPKKVFSTNNEIINKFDNVIITHTFSKFYGLASFRIGYLISRPYIVDLFSKGAQVYSASKYSVQAAAASLDNIDNYYLNGVLKATNDEKEFMYKEYDKLGLNYYKSEGNFIFIKADNFNNSDLRMYLLKNKGVLIRNVRDFALRITIGTRKENLLVIEGMKEFFNK